jgi:uncharacterized protein YijF (DUF1287 family)
LPAERVLLFRGGGAQTRSERAKIQRVAPAFHGKKFLALALSLGAAVSAALAQTRPSTPNEHQQFLDKLVKAAVERTNHSVKYVSIYVHLDYPGGDVPADTGVCSDEIIRAYRVVGVDLQKEVHEDIAKNWTDYPLNTKWHQTHPDSSIDHRRVPNLMVFFARKGDSLPVSLLAKEYLPGDIVTWDLGGGVPHIGMVVNAKSSESGRPLIVHNIGQGPKMEDVLFSWKITGHYRYFGPLPRAH